MPPQADNNVVLEGVQLIFRNFSGKENQYNREGSREFSVRLTDEVAEAMAADGWNVKTLKPREGDDGVMEPPQHILPVALKYGKGRPPRVALINSISKRRNNLGENEVEILDWADIVNVDLIVRPYHWTMSDGKSGVKAYVQSMFVTIVEDPLEQKYSEMDAAES